MEDRGSTLFLTNLVRVNPRNIQTEYEANPCLERSRKGKKVPDNDNGHMM